MKLVFQGSTGSLHSCTTGTTGHELYLRLLPTGLTGAADCADAGSLSLPLASLSTLLSVTPGSGGRVSSQ
eukprot:3187-Eustigmatos_ZCMA.PRE.1